MSVNDFKIKLFKGELKIPPLAINVLEGEGGKAIQVDISWRGASCRFVAELKPDAKPQTLKLAKEQAKDLGRTGLGQPLVIAPYLSDEKLSMLLGEGVSALDFCGNGAVEVPGRFFFYKTGNPNKFPDSTPIESAYDGDYSLIARMLLLKREFSPIGEIRTAIQRRGGSIALGTISKVLQRLEADLVIDRPNRNAVRVIQADRILDGLLAGYRAPKIESTWMGKVSLSLTDLLGKLQRLPASEAVRTGASSAGEYATWAGEPMIACHCRGAPGTLLMELEAGTKETRAFANLQLLQTKDQRVYFDRRDRMAASPIQSWLEMATGDKRQKEAADQIRQRILKDSGGMR